MDSLIEVVVTEKVLEKHPARDWGYTRKTVRYYCRKILIHQKDYSVLRCLSRKHIGL